MEAAKRSEGIGINEVGANEFHTFILFATDLNKRQQAMQSVSAIRTQSIPSCTGSNPNNPTLTMF